jgi:hypothetical protein
MINGVPWINVDPFIDIERLKDIELDIIHGMCVADKGIAAYGMIKDELNRPDFIQIKSMIATASPRLKNVYYDLLTIQDEVARINALKLYGKLCFGTYSGGLTIMLRAPNETYLDKNTSERCHDTTNVERFPSLMEFIRGLPFTEIGRVLIFLNDHDLVTPLHTDHNRSKFQHNEFLWFRPNLEKKFFLYDPETKVKHHVTSHAAFFNEQDWHGTDPSTKMCFSIRVDGVFTEDFRKQLKLDSIANYNE